MVQASPHISRVFYCGRRRAAVARSAPYNRLDVLFKYAFIDFQSADRTTTALRRPRYEHS